MDSSSGTASPSDLLCFQCNLRMKPLRRLGVASCESRGSEGRWANSLPFHFPGCGLILLLVLLTSPVCGKNNKTSIEAVDGSWALGAPWGRCSLGLCAACCSFTPWAAPVPPLLAVACRRRPAAEPSQSRAWPEGRWLSELPGPACAAQAACAQENR